MTRTCCAELGGLLLCVFSMPAFLSTSGTMTKGSQLLKLDGNKAGAVVVRTVALSGLSGQRCVLDSVKYNRQVLAA